MKIINIYVGVGISVAIVGWIVITFSAFKPMDAAAGTLTLPQANRKGAHFVVRVDRRSGRIEIRGAKGEWVGFDAVNSIGTSYQPRLWSVQYQSPYPYQDQVQDQNAYSYPNPNLQSPYSNGYPYPYSNGGVDAGSGPYPSYPNTPPPQQVPVPYAYDYGQSPYQGQGPPAGSVAPAPGYPYAGMPDGGWGNLYGAYGAPSVQWQQGQYYYYSWDGNW